MAKVLSYYNGKMIKFDSQLEVDYLDHLQSQQDVLNVVYQPEIKVKISDKNRYTPDFWVEYADRYEIIETKGYNQFSAMRDNITHNVMESLTQDQLKLYAGYLFKQDKKIVYRKIKKVAIGFVEFNWKNPNTLSKKRKEKVVSLEAQLKEANNQIKDYERYFKYFFADKLTKDQREWLESFLEKKRG